MKIKITANLPEEAIEKIAQRCADIMLKNKTDVSSKATKTYTTKQVAGITNKSQATIQRHCEKGILDATKPGKSWIISEFNLNEYISKNE